MRATTSLADCPSGPIYPHGIPKTQEINAAQAANCAEAPRMRLDSPACATSPQHGEFLSTIHQVSEGTDQ